MTWEVPDRTEDHYPEGACSCGADLADAADLGVVRSFQQEEVPAAAAERVQHDLHKAECATYVTCQHVPDAGCWHTGSSRHMVQGTGDRTGFMLYHSPAAAPQAPAAGPHGFSYNCIRKLTERSGREGR